ncbi:hypothetical protein CYMTET_7284 [Cymbomonas tetramitiformis]|uniref:Uncharacterized protein n=1 Tax=Cymbomonas tetramitiformis TaxID=36881 RepID=A0AAE0LHL5_9CHLO|nr:hypothetical protein CYMTET_7284 [Cymbomonas tetramitiformis]
MWRLHCRWKICVFVELAFSALHTLPLQFACASEVSAKGEGTFRFRKLSNHLPEQQQQAFFAGTAEETCIDGPTFSAEDLADVAAVRITATQGPSYLSWTLPKSKLNNSVLCGFEVGMYSLGSYVMLQDGTSFIAEQFYVIVTLGPPPPPSLPGVPLPPFVPSRPPRPPFAPLPPPQPSPPPPCSPPPDTSTPSPLSTPSSSPTQHTAVPSIPAPVEVWPPPCAPCAGEQTVRAYSVCECIDWMQLTFFVQNGTYPLNETLLEEDVADWLELSQERITGLAVSALNESIFVSLAIESPRGESLFPEEERAQIISIVQGDGDTSHMRLRLGAMHEAAVVSFGYTLVPTATPSISTQTPTHTPVMSTLDKLSELELPIYIFILVTVSLTLLASFMYLILRKQTDEITTLSDLKSLEQGEPSSSTGYRFVSMLASRLSWKNKELPTADIPHFDPNAQVSFRRTSDLLSPKSGRENEFFGITNTLFHVSGSQKKKEPSSFSRGMMSLISPREGYYL